MRFLSSRLARALCGLFVFYTLVSNAGPAIAHDQGNGPQATPSQNDLMPPARLGAVEWTPQELACQGAVVVTGHRGGLGLGTRQFDGRRYTENTIAAFRYALGTLGACAVETDVRRTCDHVLVLNHDAGWWRTTNAVGRVGRKCFPYVARHHANSGDPIATYRAMLEAMTNDPSCYRQVELKSVLATSDLQQLLDLDASLVKDPSCVLFTSMELNRLKALDDLSSQVATGFIAPTNHLPDLDSIPAFVDLVMVSSSAVNNDFVLRAHARGLFVSARDVNTVETFNTMRTLGVDRVVTDSVAAVAPAMSGTVGQ